MIIDDVQNCTYRLVWCARSFPEGDGDWCFMATFLHIVAGLDIKVFGHLSCRKSQT